MIVLLSHQALLHSQPYKTMAWEQVKIKVGKDTILGMQNGNRIEMPFTKVNETLNVNGEDLKVLSQDHDKRDNNLKIILAIASPTKEKSDDKPTQGTD